MVASELLLVMVNNFNCILNIYHASHVKNLLICINCISALDEVLLL